MSKKSTNSFWVIVVIIAIVFLFVFSFGSISSDNINIPKELKDSREEAEKKHKLIEEKLAEKIELKKKLERKSKRIYLGVRIGLVLVWALIMATLFWYNLINSLEDFLNYSEVSVLIILTINFLNFGNFKNLKDNIQMLKTRIENWVYGKHVNIEDEIKKLNAAKGDNENS